MRKSQTDGEKKEEKQGALKQKDGASQEKSEVQREATVWNSGESRQGLCTQTKVVSLPPAMAVFLPTVTVTAVVAITILPAGRATQSQKGRKTTRDFSTHARGNLGHVQKITHTHTCMSTNSGKGDVFFSHILKTSAVSLWTHAAIVTARCLEICARQIALDAAGNI